MVHGVEGRVRVYLPPRSAHRSPVDQLAGRSACEHLLKITPHDRQQPTHRCHRRPTSAPSPESSKMVRSSSAEPAKTTKLKGTSVVCCSDVSSSWCNCLTRLCYAGTRSVLAPSQLARKRANDREAQRAIRARTKEHIGRLERELDELKSKQSRDQTVQELLRRNKAAEDELNRLKNMGISMASSPYSTPGIMNEFTCIVTSILTLLNSRW